MKTPPAWDSLRCPHCGTAPVLIELPFRWIVACEHDGCTVMPATKKLASIEHACRAWLIYCDRMILSTGPVPAESRTIANAGLVPTSH